MQPAKKKPNRFARQKQSLEETEEPSKNSFVEFHDNYLETIKVAPSSSAVTSSTVPIRHMMEEEREKGLSTHIPKSNIGFKLLQKFGYEEGSGLGKDGKGIVEPIIVLKRDPTESSSGLGILERKRKHRELMNAKKEDMIQLRAKLHEQYKTYLKEIHVQTRLKKDIGNAVKVVHELDLKHNHCFSHYLSDLWDKIEKKRSGVGEKESMEKACLERTSISFDCVNNMKSLYEIGEYSDNKEEEYEIDFSPLDESTPPKTAAAELKVSEKSSTVAKYDINSMIT